MKSSIVRIALLACGALLATHAVAQTPANQPRRVAPLGAKAPAVQPTKTMTAAVIMKAAAVAPVAVSAAGSLILLADGIVANATFAQIQPPAPGFVYEN